MKITERTKKVLDFLFANPITTIPILIEKMNLDDRAIRYELNNIDFYLSMFNYESILKEAKGKLSVNVDDISKLVNSLNDIVMVSSEERRKFIAYTLLMAGKINLTKLTEKFEVSRNTIRSDVIQVEEELSDMGFIIHEHSIRGDEEFVRHQLSNIFVKSYRILFQTVIKDGYNINVVEQSLLEEFSICDKKEIFVDFDGIKEGAIDLDRMKAYFVIVLQRVKRGFILKKKEEVKPYLRKTNIYKQLFERTEIIKKQLNISLSDIELLSFTNRICTEKEKDHNSVVFETLIQSKNFIEWLIRCVEDELQVNISEDKILKEGLLEHFKTIIYRVKNHIMVEDIIYYDAIQDYRELYEIVKKNLRDFEDLIGEELTKEEASLITVHFLGALKRYNDISISKKNIILLYGTGYGTSIVVKSLIESNYEVQVVDTISLYQLADYKIEHIDYIVSTIKVSYEMEKLTSVPIIKISPFLGFDDAILLERFHIQRKHKLEENQYGNVLEIISKNVNLKQFNKIKDEIEVVLENKKNMNKSLFHLLHYDDIQIVNRLENWEDALTISGDHLVKKDNIESEYVEEIFNTINNHGAYFVIRNEIAMPHGQISEFIKKNGMFVLYIKEGVDFPGERNVRLVFFLAAYDKDLLLNTVLRINEISHMTNLYERIEQCKSNIDLLDDILNEKEREI